MDFDGIETHPIFFLKLGHTCKIDQSERVLEFSKKDVDKSTWIKLEKTLTKFYQVFDETLIT